MQKIITFLWFDNQAEEAAEFYVSLFSNAEIREITRYNRASSEVSGKANGSVMTVTFRIENQEFIAINGGPHFKFTPAISLFVNCEMQEEVNELWEKLSEGGNAGQCGWLTDKYGLSWQIVPTALGRLLKSGSVAQSERVTKAMLQMKKFDISSLQRAFDHT